MNRQPSRTASRRRDEVAGFWPGVQLAVGLGVVTGAVTVLVSFGWLYVSNALGRLEADEVSLLASAIWLSGFWIALSVALLVALSFGYIAWERAVLTRAQRRALREQQDAVDAAEAILEATRSSKTPK